MVVLARYNSHEDTDDIIIRVLLAKEGRHYVVYSMDRGYSWVKNFYSRREQAVSAYVERVVHAERLYMLRKMLGRG